ncbi:protein CgeA [Bacillus altitudinis]|uniref:protein CgeA n=1 Tax=Bacillus altitudinis TaxID=293387 RepID=UPI002406F286|nr:protein CgeA [Bacillus altitudinis]MDF9416733.1 protein CgeA [Bacillus altitudinis]
MVNITPDLSALGLNISQSVGFGHNQSPTTSSSKFNGLFAGLTPGTALDIVGDSGYLYGPGSFVTYDQTTGIVFFNDPTSGGGTATSLIDVNKIESVTFTG